MPSLTVRDLVFIGLGPVSFDLPAATLTGLSGPSGAGKSRLLRALADLDPHQGRVLLDDTEQSAVAAPQWRRQVGLLPAEPRYWLATGRDHLRGDGGGEEPAWREALGLDDALLDRPIKRLSSGERQRLGLLRLLLLEPRVLLLDEPSANLDRRSASAVEALVADYAGRRRAAVFWVGHDEQQMRRICAHQWQLAEGRLERLR